MKRTFLLAGFAAMLPLYAASADVANDVGRITKEANQGFVTCSLYFSIAHTLSATDSMKSAKVSKAFDDAVRCREKELAHADDLVSNLKASLQAKPKAIDALKEFYTYWRSSLQNLGKIKSDDFMKGIAARAEAIRTEASW